MDVVTRRDLSGHANSMMTDDYTHSAAETKQAAVDAIMASVVASPSNFPPKQNSRPARRL